MIALGSAKQENDGRALLTKQNGDKSEKLNKKSTELRLYCDLLVQQVDTIQERYRNILYTYLLGRNIMKNICQRIKGIGEQSPRKYGFGECESKRKCGYA